MGGNTRSEWQPIATAPRDGTRFKGWAGLLAQPTWYGKTAHVPLYGWCYLADPSDVESCDLWSPTHWQPLPAPPTEQQEGER